METFILVTLGPVDENLAVPDDILDTAAKSHLRFAERVKYRKRYFTFSSRRAGSDVVPHLLAVQDMVFDLVNVLRGLFPDLPIQLGCIVYGDAQNGMLFTNAQLRRIAELGMTLDIQAYGIGED